MYNKPKYKRIFLIFDREDSGYSDGGELSGYVRLEVRDGKGKLFCQVLNLKEDARIGYKLYIVKTDETGLVPLFVGNIPVTGGKGELNWNFDAENVGGTSFSIEDFNVAAVLAENKDSSIGGIFCPLAAYNGAKVEWRREMAKSIKDRHRSQQPKPEAIVEQNSKSESIKKVTAGNEETPEATKIGREDERKDEDETDNTIPVDLRDDESKKEEYQDITRKSIGDEYDIAGLPNCFDKHFKRCNPFVGGRKDYAWWQVSGPVQLNNILYQANIKAPLLFNQRVLAAHFKHRHLIAGFYEDRERELLYLVCGIPGVYGEDKKPVEGVCRWAQAEGSIPEYGAFGYWLVYIDPKTSGVLNAE
ncbi:MAG: hypothetical protein GX992_10180 [Clostridium sp.]|nr:hypothetical protein [Clostridium sp.]